LTDCGAGLTSAGLIKCSSTMVSGRQQSGKCE